MWRKLRCEEVVKVLSKGPATSTQIIQALFNEGYYDVKSVRGCIKRLLRSGLLKREPDPSVRGFVYVLTRSGRNPADYA